MATQEILARKERLKKLRKWLNLSADEMGDTLGIDRSTYYLSESPTNNNFLNKLRLDEVVKKTGVRREWLLNGEEPMFQNETTTSIQVAIPGTEQVFDLPIDPKATKITIILRRG